MISEEGEPVDSVENESLGSSRRNQKQADNHAGDIPGDVESGLSLSKLRLGTDAVRKDALQIVEGSSLFSGLWPFSLILHIIDPLYRVRRHKPTTESQPSTSNGGGNSAQVKRMLSVKSNRRRKFIECLTAEDVSIGNKPALSGSHILTLYLTN